MFDEYRILLLQQIVLVLQFSLHFSLIHCYCFDDLPYILVLVHDNILLLLILLDQGLACVEALSELVGKDRYLSSQDIVLFLKRD